MHRAHLVQHDCFHESSAGNQHRNGNQSEDDAHRHRSARHAGIAESGECPRACHLPAVFRHLVALKGHAKDVERQGRNGAKLRSHYKEKINLKDEHASLLDKIAVESDREVAKLDAKAKKITDEFHARYPKGIVPAGEKLPPPPAELKELQRQRDMSILRARHQLRTSLGEHGFKQIDDYIKLNFAPNVKPAPIRQRSLSGQPRSGNQK